jgi:hypothetical protein
LRQELKFFDDDGTYWYHHCKYAKNRKRERVSHRSLSFWMIKLQFKNIRRVKVMQAQQSWIAKLIHAMMHISATHMFVRTPFDY